MRRKEFMMSPRRHWLPLLSVVALLLTPFALAPRFSAAQAEAAIYTVTTTADTLAGDCRPTPATCSLRQAILAANADGVTSLIQFSLPAGLQTVTPSSVLPALSGTGDRVLGQEDNFGRPRIVIDGGNSLRYGFQVTGSNNTIERLIFNRFVSGSAPNGVGVWITGAGATGNRLFGNYFGVQPGSTSSFTNQRGIQIDIIGGALGEPTQRNIIAGNNFSGVFISGANGNFVRGNYIGLTLDAGGAVAALGNNGPGIEISESTTNEVGGSFAQRNLIADNAEAKSLVPM
jgi:CSLREA domain-containing protein